MPLHRLQQPLLAAAVDSLVGYESRYVEVTQSGQVLLDLRNANAPPQRRTHHAGRTVGGARAGSPR